MTREVTMDHAKKEGEAPEKPSRLILQRRVEEQSPTQKNGVNERREAAKKQ